MSSWQFHDPKNKQDCKAPPYEQKGMAMIRSFVKTP